MLRKIKTNKFCVVIFDCCMSLETNGDSGGMATQTTNIFFTKLEKFSGEENTISLWTWTKNFFRCCVIANRTDEKIQGQLLMLCVEGRAKAILEDFEESEKATDPKRELVLKDYLEKLEEIFQSDASKELNMTTFENRTQKLNETEEEYMYELVKLYKFANPMSSTADVDTAVKRRFLHGISQDLCRNRGGAPRLVRF